MHEELQVLIRDWDGLGVVSRYDRPTGTWIFIALHDDSRGRPTGGTRVRVYGRAADGLRDAMRLAEGMTLKWAWLGLDAGGGKAVLAVPRPLDGAERVGLLRRYAALLNSLRGSFSTGRDLGTTDEDMRTLAEVTRYVHGVDPPRDPGPYTAAGVLAAVRATCRVLWGEPSPAGRTVLIQGVGDVGVPLARRLAEAGARLLLCDVEHARVERLARELGPDVDVTMIDSAAAHDTECDLLAPCAVGGTLDRETIPRLRCRAVVGSANNQLATDEDAERLHRRGILYAPDFVANGGGALAFLLIARGVTDDEELYRRVGEIEHSIARIFDEASRRNESTLRAAYRLVESDRAGPGNSPR